MWDSDTGDASWTYWSVAGAVESTEAATQAFHCWVKVLGWLPVRSPRVPRPQLNSAVGPRSVWGIPDVKH